MGYIVSVLTGDEVIRYNPRPTLLEAENLANSIISFKQEDDRVFIHNICEVCGEAYPAYTQCCKGIVV